MAKGFHPGIRCRYYISLQDHIANCVVLCLRAMGAQPKFFVTNVSSLLERTRSSTALQDPTRRYVYRQLIRALQLSASRQATVPCRPTLGEDAHEQAMPVPERCWPFLTATEKLAPPPLSALRCATPARRGMIGGGRSPARNACLRIPPPPVLRSQHGELSFYFL